MLCRFSAKTNFGKIIRIKSIPAVMKGIERIDEKIFNFIKSCRSIFIDIGDVKMKKFNIKSVWVFYDRKKSSALLILSSARIPLVRVSNNGKPRNWGCGAAGSALAWHARGRGFEPR